MSNLNRVFIMGNLTRDPEVRYTPKGTCVGEIGLAVNDSFKGADGAVKETVTFLDIEVWGRQAENCKQYLAKGKSVFVEGRLNLEQWEQDGKKRQKLKVVASSVQFLGGKADQTTSTASYRKASEIPKEDDSRPSDDIPF